MDALKECGVYIIRNTINNKAYIGQSINVKNRISRHFSKLRLGKHINEHLQSSFNKNKSSFTSKVLIKCDKQALDFWECYFISIYGTMNNKKGYNRDSGGSTSKFMSDETKEKIRQIKLKNPPKGMKGEEHPSWVNVTKDMVVDANVFEYRHWLAKHNFSIRIYNKCKREDVSCDFIKDIEIKKSQYTDYELKKIPFRVDVTEEMVKDALVMQHRAWTLKHKHTNSVWQKIRKDNGIYPSNKKYNQIDLTEDMKNDLFNLKRKEFAKKYSVSEHYVAKKRALNKYLDTRGGGCNHDIKHINYLLS